MYFKIVFDNPSESYFAGHIVSGKVHLHLTEEKKVKSLKLKFVGKGQALFARQSGDLTRVYEAVEYYLNRETVLVGEGSEDTTIPVGNHAYNFRFALPTGIPSSFEAEYGRVQYFALATLSKSWGFAKKTSSYFTVNGIVDLNADLTAANPVGLSETHVIPLMGFLGYCWCCTNSSAGFTLNLDKTGFVPGEVVNFSVVAFNESGHSAKPLRAKIIQVATFYVRKPTSHKRQSTITVKELIGPSVVNSGGGSTNWEPRDGHGHVLKIPPVPPTNLGGGTVITLEYFLEVSFRVSTTCIPFKVDARIPITIGTIPFRNTFEQLMPSSRFHQNSESGQAPSAPNESPSAREGKEGLPAYGALAIPVVLEGYPDLPPPTYAEAMLVFEKSGSVPSPRGDTAFFSGDDKAEEIDEAGAGRPFLPRYATYDWGHT